MKCPQAKLCGGCPLIGMAYEKQGELKRKTVQEQLAQAGLKIKVGPVLMAKTPAAYRNKVILGFAKLHSKTVYSGLYAAKSHKVVNTAGCAMHPQIINDIQQEITSLVQSMKIELYYPKTRTGLLRHVLIRWGAQSGEIMVVLVTSRREFPSRKNFVRALTEKFPQITTILQNVNPRDTSIVLQDETLCLYGKGTITDKLCGLDITLTPSSFYQINHDQCEELYKLAARMLDLNKTETLLDTYCGVGTIGLYLAKDCKKVTGVEINREAIECARLNARQNGVENIQFTAADATRYMEQSKAERKHWDVIVLDPPRAGTTYEFISSACALRPEKILYISCDPTTQIRDLKQFARFGYTTSSMELVDMFPNTAHIESVVLLTHKPGRSSAGKDKKPFTSTFQKPGSSFGKERKGGFQKPSGRKPKFGK